MDVKLMRLINGQEMEVCVINLIHKNQSKNGAN